MRELCWLVLFALLAPLPAHAIELQPCRDDRFGERAYCGVLRVPEDRERPSGRQIDLRIVVQAAAAPSGNEPVFMLAGGPGQAATDLAGIVRNVFRGPNEIRDFILVDQRGTGQSRPVDCPVPVATEPATAFGDLFEPASIAACLETLEQRADVRRYTTLDAVRDLEEVRRALGYEKVFLWGASGGTRTALTWLREFPTSIAAVLLDGVTPTIVAIPAGFATAAQEALDRLFADCAAQPECRTAFPNPAADLESLLDRFRDGPVETSISLPDGSTESVQLGRGDFVYSIRGMLYNARRFSHLPRLLRQAVETRDLAHFAQAHWERQVGVRPSISMGVHFAGYCAEDIPFTDPVANARASAETFLGTWLSDQYAAACANWNAEPMPATLRQPVVADVPVLLFSGYYDPSTPPDYGELVASTLANSRHIVVRDSGHGSQFGCGREAAAQFLLEGSLSGLGAVCDDAGPVEFVISDPDS